MKKADPPIVLEQIYDAAIEDVWSAITEPAEMAKWFFEEIESFKPEVGFETRFTVKVEDRIYPHLWKVTEVVPNKKISYIWRYEGYPGCAISDFELYEKNYQTLLRLTYTAVEDFPDNILEFTRESGLEGWKYFLRESLRQYLDEDEE